MDDNKYDVEVVMMGERFFTFTCLEQEIEDLVEGFGKGKIRIFKKDKTGYAVDFSKCLYIKFCRTVK
jgi:hypothetical protein